MAVVEGDHNLLVIGANNAAQIEKLDGAGVRVREAASFAVSFRIAATAGGHSFAMLNLGPDVVGIKSIVGDMTINSTAVAASSMTAEWKKGPTWLSANQTILYPAQVGGFPRRPSQVQVRQSASGTTVIEDTVQLVTICSLLLPYSVTSKRFAYEHEFYTPGDSQSYLELLPGEALVLQPGAPGTGFHGASGMITWDEYPLEEYL